MTENAYEILALAARYIFIALMALVVVRGARITFIDNQRAASLRKWSPETGLVGEMRVLKGAERIRRGMVFPVIREGMIGQSYKADIRLRSKSILRCHAHFEISENGLWLRAEHSAPMEYNGHSVQQILLHDGDQIRLGKILLLLVLNNATKDSPNDALFHPQDAPDNTLDSLFAPTDSDRNEEATRHAQ